MASHLLRKELKRSLTAGARGLGVCTRKNIGAVGITGECNGGTFASCDAFFILEHTELDCPVTGRTKPGVTWPDDLGFPFLQAVGDGCSVSAIRRITLRYGFVAG